MRKRLLWLRNLLKRTDTVFTKFQAKAPVERPETVRLFGQFSTLIEALKSYTKRCKTNNKYFTAAAKKLEAEKSSVGTIGDIADTCSEDSYKFLQAKFNSLVKKQTAFTQSAPADGRQITMPTCLSQTN